MSLPGGFSWTDLVLVLLAFGGLALGYVQGLLRQVIGLAVLYIAVILGAQYYPYIGAFLRTIMFHAPSSRLFNVVSFAIIVGVVSTLLNWLATDAYRSTKLKLLPVVDQVGGSLLGLVTMTVGATIGLAVITFLVGEAWPNNDHIRLFIDLDLKMSRLVPVFESFKEPFLDAVKLWLPGSLPSIFNL